MGTMDKLFRLMSDKKATDLFLSVGAPITIKMHGNSVPVNPAILDAARKLLNLRFRTPRRAWYDSGRPCLFHRRERANPRGNDQT